MNYLYLVDNKCYYKDKKNNVYELEYDEHVLLQGKIVEIQKFYKKTYTFLHFHKLVSIFFNQKLTCIVNPTYTKVDKFLLKDQLEKMNFDVKKIVDPTDILNLATCNYLEMNESNITIYYRDVYNQVAFRLIPNYFFKTTIDLISYIEKTINNKHDMFIYGEAINKHQIKQLEKIIKGKCYYLESPQKYLLNRCTI